MKIVVATEGPDVSRIILPHARLLAAATGANIAVVRVLRPLNDLASDRSANVKDAIANVSARWEAEQRAVLAESSIDAEVRIAILPHGEDVHDTIIAEAKDLGADVVALRANNTGAVRHALLGSIAAQIVAHTPFPVLAVGPKAEGIRSGMPYHIIATDDGSEVSGHAIARLGHLLGGADARVTLLRVHEPSQSEPEGDSIAHLNALRKHFTDTTNVETKVYRAPNSRGIDDTILVAAKDLNADLIAMATHGHGMLRHILLGSVALDVVSSSPVPVLLFRAS